MPRAAETSRVLAALVDVGIRPLLMKGLPLAYTHYAAPQLRTAVDVDMIVDPVEFEAAIREFSTLGYTALGDGAVTQVALVRRDERGAPHVVDLHSHFSGGDLFPDLPAFAELAERSRPVPQLGPHARALCPVHALLLACAHRLHHTSSDRLIWLCDIDLLVRRMDREELGEFTALARERRLSDACARGLRAARRELGTEIPLALAGLGAGTASIPELSRVLAPDDPRAGHRIARELLRREGWRSRLDLTRAYFFPAPAYMRERYGLRHSALLPAAYLYRLLRAVAVPFRRLR
jgi:hypothetical protein